MGGGRRQARSAQEGAAQSLRRMQLGRHRGRGGSASASACSSTQPILLPPPHRQDVARLERRRRHSSNLHPAQRRLRLLAVCCRCCIRRWRRRRRRVLQRQRRQLSLALPLACACTDVRTAAQGGACSRQPPRLHVLRRRALHLFRPLAPPVDQKRDAPAVPLLLLPCRRGHCLEHAVRLSAAAARGWRQRGVADVRAGEQGAAEVEAGAFPQRET